MRRQTTTPHNSCDRSPVRQLRSLLRYPRPCGDTVGTCDALCGHAWHCFRSCVSYSPYSLRTFSTAEPSIGMGATLGHGPGIDQSKTSTWRTLDALPRMPGGRYPQQQPPRRPQELSGRQRDLRKARTSPRTTARPVPYSLVPHSVPSTVDIHCAPLIRGEDDNFRPPVHVHRPSLCL